MKPESQVKMEILNKIKDIFEIEKNIRNENSKHYLSKSNGSVSLAERNYFDNQAWAEGVKLIAVLNDLEKTIIKAIK